MSKEYENRLANEIHDITPDHVKSYRCGYSGSLRIAQPDVLVTCVNDNWAMEVKGPIHSDYCYIDPADVEQLVECGGSVTNPVLVVKFANRAPTVIRYFERATVDGWNDMSQAERLAAVTNDAFDARVTATDKLALSKPSLDDWPSAREADSDAHEVCYALGIENENSISVSEI